MKRTDFNYDLPPELIAQYPTSQRSASRLLVLNKTTGEIAHRQFIDLPDYLNKGDLLVFNNTRVLPARLFGHKPSGGKIEILIERIVDKQHALAHIRSSHAPKPETVLLLDKNQKAIVMGRDGALFQLYFPDTHDLLALLHQIGHIPLPPYIERDDEMADKERYQTVYSKTEGSVAAPTAGLHYDENLLAQLKAKGVQMGFVTLHVGAGTFKPVRVDDITEHTMHAEYIEVSSEVCAQIKTAQAAGKRVIAVGTTTARSLETAAQEGDVQPYQGDTRIFIYPGYRFKCINALQTNFHLPESTLIMLVAALAGYDHTMQAYHAAVHEKYRFFSYGDSMLVI